MTANTRTAFPSASTFLKMIAVWIPIVGGVIHQLLMFFLNTPAEPRRGDGIYVFLNPPEYVYPFVSLEYTWWFVLLAWTAVMCVVSYTDRVRSIPTRFWAPFYFYILFLLFFVKPV